MFCNWWLVSPVLFIYKIHILYLCVLSGLHNDYLLSSILTLLIITFIFFLVTYGIECGVIQELAHEL